MTYKVISSRQIQRYCNSAQVQEGAGILSIDFSFKKKGKYGQKGKFTYGIKALSLKSFAYSWRRVSRRSLVDLYCPRHFKNS